MFVQGTQQISSINRIWQIVDSRFRTFPHLSIPMFHYPTPPPPPTTPHDGVRISGGPQRARLTSAQDLSAAAAAAAVVPSR